VQRTQDGPIQGGRRLQTSNPGKLPPLVSIVIVVFRARAELETLLNSVLALQLSDSEIVVMDGGSDDGTVEYLQNLGEQIDFWSSERDSGIYDAMNKAAGLATGEWIIFMNAGDFFYDSQVLERIAGVLAGDQSSVFIYGDAEIVQGDRRHIQHQQARHLDQTKSIIHQSMFIRRAFLKDHPYDIRYRIMADYDNLLTVSATHPEQCRHIDLVICRYDKTGVSSRPLYTYFKEYYRVARHRMTGFNFVRYNLYIFPRLVWSFRFKIR